MIEDLLLSALSPTFFLMERRSEGFLTRTISWISYSLPSIKESLDFKLMYLYVMTYLMKSSLLHWKSKAITSIFLYSVVWTISNLPAPSSIMVNIAEYLRKININLISKPMLNKMVLDRDCWRIAVVHFASNICYFPNISDFLTGFRSLYQLYWSISHKSMSNRCILRLTVTESWWLWNYSHLPLIQIVKKE